MQITTHSPSDTERELTIIPTPAQRQAAKQQAITHLGKDLKVAGFRPGKAPEHVIEKHLSPATLQEEFLNSLINTTYPLALEQEKVQAVTRPTISVTKFVPYEDVEYTATVGVISVKKLANYRALSTKKDKASVDPKRVDEVIDNIRVHMAERIDVDRAAKDGDQAWIDFNGTDAKGAEVKGAKGTNYPLTLGSGTFIPGFEDHVVGMKAGDDKTFTLTFPADYGVKALQSKKVTFAVSVQKVQEIVRPPLDDALAKKVAPELHSVAELKADIDKQLQIEAEQNAQRSYENAMVAELVASSDVAVPQELIDEQVEAVQRELQQNITYRGQTMQEYLDAIGMTAEEQRTSELVPEAERRIKAGVILSEIADKEDISLTPEELDIRVGVLKQRYRGDQQMLAELEKPERRREVGSQVLTEKTVARIIALQN